MATEQTSNGSQPENGNENPVANQSILTFGGLRNTVFAQYRKAKEDAEAYPYVWASYLVVYGGIGIWFAYKFKKLRNTEDRVRALQEKLRRLHQERNPTIPSTVTENVKSSAGKDTK